MMKYFELFYFSQVIPIVSISFVLLLFIYKLYYEIRSRYDVAVNCWFCSENTRVPFKQQNSWICPNSVCRQYNGFTSDGGYNKEIVEQFDSSRNSNTSAMLFNDDNNYIINREILKESNGFCNDCNENQRLKVEKLSQFEPKNESKYIEEIEEYKRHLEELYRLCPTCEKQLGRVLREKKKMILGSKFLDFLAKGADTLRKHPRIMLIKKFHNTKWKTVTAIMILLLAVSNFCLATNDIVKFLKKGLGKEFLDSVIRFILSGISYAIATCKIFQNFILVAFNTPFLRKSFLFTRLIIFLLFQYFGVKVPTFHFDYDKFISLGIPIASILLTFFRNILDKFHITRYTILLTIWSINVAAINMQPLHLAECLKLFTSVAALIFSIPKIHKYSTMDTTNNSFHKIYSDDAFIDDEDSISLLSSYKASSFNNSVKSFNINDSKYSQNVQSLRNASSHNFKLNQKSNSHSPVSPFKRNRANEHLLQSRSFTPISQCSSRQYMSNVEVNRPCVVRSPQNNLDEIMLSPFNGSNLYKNDSWSNNTIYACSNIIPKKTSNDYILNSNHFSDNSSICGERFTQSPFHYSTNSQQNRSSLLSPSRLGLDSNNFGLTTQSWISGGFFNCNQRDVNMSNRNIVNSIHNQNINKTDNLSRASSQSSGFESNSSSTQNCGLRYRSRNHIDMTNDYLNSTNQPNRVNVERDNEPYILEQCMSLQQSPTQIWNNTFQSKNLELQNNFHHNEECDWRPFKTNSSMVNGLGINGTNPFNLTRMNEELTPIERGSLLRKWKEQNLIS